MIPFYAQMRDIASEGGVQKLLRPRGYEMRETRIAIDQGPELLSGPFGSAI
jgi:hypothetical protein